MFPQRNQDRSSFFFHILSCEFSKTLPEKQVEKRPRHLVVPIYGIPEIPRTFQSRTCLFVTKGVFGYRKVRYRGLAKNRARAHTLCGMLLFHDYIVKKRSSQYFLYGYFAFFRGCNSPPDFYPVSRRISSGRTHRKPTSERSPPPSVFGTSHRIRCSPPDSGR